MYDFFISYKRDSGGYVAQLLCKLLEEIKIPGLDRMRVHFDLNAMREGPFSNQLYQSIDNSTALLLVLTSNVFQSEWVINEIVYAHDHGKPIIMVADPDYSPPPSEAGLPQKLRGWRFLEYHYDVIPNRQVTQELIQTILVRAGKMESEYAKRMSVVLNDILRKPVTLSAASGKWKAGRASFGHIHDERIVSYTLGEMWESISYLWRQWAGRADDMFQFRRRYPLLHWISDMLFAQMELSEIRDDWDGIQEFTTSWSTRKADPAYGGVPEDAVKIYFPLVQYAGDWAYRCLKEDMAMEYETEHRTDELSQEEVWTQVKECFRRSSPQAYAQESKEWLDALTLVLDLVLLGKKPESGPHERMYVLIGQTAL